LFESLSYLFAIVCKDVDTDILKDKVVRLKENFDNSDYFSNSVDSSKSVEYRFKQVIILKDEIC